MFAAITVGGMIALLLYFLNILRNRKYHAIEQKYGGPKGLPFFGIFLHLIKSEGFFYEWPKLIRNKDSKSAFVWYGPIPVFYTQNPNFSEKIFLSPDCNAKSKSYMLMDNAFGPSLITLGGSEWGHHRKLLNPCFNHRILLSFFPIFNEKCSSFLQELGSLVGKGEVDVLKRVQHFNFKTILVTLMNYQFEDNDKRTENLIVHACRFWKLFMIRSRSLVGDYDFLYRFNKHYQPYAESEQIVKDFVSELINERIQSTKLDENQKLSAADEFINIKKSNYRFLDQAVHLHQKDFLSWNEIYCETLTLIFIGFETTSGTMHSVLMFLAMYPQYQEKLFEEVLSLYPEKDFNVKYEDLKHLVYMDMVINETMRVSATAPFIGRLVTKDLKISDDLVLPSGTNVIIDLYNMHRHEGTWGPNAKQFNPDNFLPENLDKMHPNCFMPFVKGSRICIGWRYAGLFLKSSLAKIIRNYRFTTKFRYEDLRAVEGVTLEYEYMPRLEVHRR